VTDEPARPFHRSRALGAQTGAAQVQVTTAGVVTPYFGTALTAIAFDGLTFPID